MKYVRNINNTSLRDEKWDEKDIAKNLNYNLADANDLFMECHKYYKINGYGPIKKEKIYEYLKEKEYNELELKTKYEANLSISQQGKSLNEQVHILKEIKDSSSADAKKAQIMSIITVLISAISAIIAFISLFLSSE